MKRMTVYHFNIYELMLFIPITSILFINNLFILLSISILTLFVNSYIDVLDILNNKFKRYFRKVEYIYILPEMKIYMYQILLFIFLIAKLFFNNQISELSQFTYLLLLIFIAYYNIINKEYSIKI